VTNFKVRWTISDDKLSQISVYLVDLNKLKCPKNKKGDVFIVAQCTHIIIIIINLLLLLNIFVEGQCVAK